MNKKIICCVHDKKSDTFEGFMAFNNLAEGVRSFEITCQNNETFKKWPEDFEFIHVATINYENGEINEEGEITKEGKIYEGKLPNNLIATAKDFVQKQKNANTPK